MRCSACDHDNRAERRFCVECGAALATLCAACGAATEPGEKFCGGCGASLVDNDRSAAGSPRPSQTTNSPATANVARSPRSYTPKHLADKILQSKSALEGERKQVTVLFADVKGSMELAEQLDPEAWHAILDKFFAILTDGVHRFEGTVNQYTGDGIMALFGAPIAHEDHAQRACYAALHLLEEVRSYSREVKRSHGLDFAVRIGLHSGDVVVGKIGDDLRMDYTAQGHTVGLAQRMESLAEANTCFVSYATAAIATGYFALDDLGPFRVKGVTEPVNVFVLRGLGAVRTRFDASRARGLTRFVGRDDDMRTLEAALAQAQAGHGQVIGVVAEAGTGKSRLCFELAERCRARGMTVNEAQAVAHGKNLPLLPILQVFRAYYGISERDDDRTVREKIAGRLLLLDESFREVLPVIFDFFGVPDPERPVPRLDPDARQRLYFAVLRKVVQRDDPSGRPPVTLIEDLHWMDAASEAFLAEWVEAIGAAGRLLVVNFRPEYHAAWMQKSYYRQIPLAPLGPEAIRELLVDLLGNDESIGGLADTIHARSGGNPFFAEEIVQTLIESGSLQGSRGSYRLTTPVARLDVPPSVRGLLGARIDRLDERDKQVLQTAAVIGKEFAEPILRQVLAATAGDALTEADLANALATLRTREFLHETALYPVAEYAFKHPLTQEVALGSQLQERRRRTHAAVAQAIEAAHADKLDEHAALLAHHYEAAGEAAAAAGWHLRAAQWLLRNDTLGAFVHLRRTRELGATLREHPEALAASAQAIHTMLINSWRVGMEPDEWEALAAQGRELAARLDDRRLLLGIELGFTLVQTLCGYVSDAIEPARRAVQLANELGDLESSAGARERVAEILWFGGRHAEALSAFEELEEMGRKNPSIGAAVGALPLRDWSLGRQGYVLSWMGRPEEAVLRFERAETGARQQGEFDMLSLLSSLRVEHAWFTGQTKNAVLYAQQALEFAERTGNPFTRLLGLSCLGLAHLCARQAREALEVLEQAVALCRQRRLLRQYFAFFLGSLAEAHLQAGDPERALAVAAEATAYARRAGTLGYELRAELVVAAARTALGAHADAQRSLDRCDDLVGQTGSAALAPFITELRARLAAARGEDPAELLRAARRQFESVGATGHVARLAEIRGGEADVSI